MTVCCWLFDWVSEDREEMGSGGLFYVFGWMLLSVSATKLDDSTLGCTESCLRINPYGILNKTLTHEVRHCTKLTDDGKCECDWERILTPQGTCECRNPRHKIDSSTNECVCDLDQCNMEKGCRGIVKDDPYGCCKEHCEECPGDSYPIDNKCTCYPCEKKGCKDDQTAVILVKGDMIPGKCCDLYKCENVNRNCTSPNGNFPHGYTSISNITCEKCTCNNGIMFCDGPKDECTYDEKSMCRGITEDGEHVYQNGEQWMRDSCTKCICEEGHVRCLTHFCEDLPSITIKPNVDCPPLTSCKKTCVFGFKLTKKGCESCKCKMPDAKWIVDLMRLYNCTLESCDLKLLTPSNHSVNTSGGVEQTKSTDYGPLKYIYPIAIGILLTFLVIVMFCICKARRRGDLSLSSFHSGVIASHGRTISPHYATVPAYPEHKVKQTVELKSFH